MAADVTATRHNNLQSRIEQVLGDGNGTYGYGQGQGYGSTPSSYQVSVDPLSNLNIASAEDINAIYSDMLRCRVHQLGTEPTEIARLIADANVIAETESFIVGNDGISVVDADGTKKGLVDFENLMSSIEADRFLLHASQAALEPGISSLRTTSWNTILTHEFTVTFNNEDHRRHFFNAGGEIRISAAVFNAVTDKGLSWTRFFESFGVIIFNHDSTRSSTTGSGTSLGNYNLTPSYQTVFTSTGTGYTNAVYNGNLYKIEARAPDYVNSSNQGKTIKFKITMNDVAVDNAVDNFVDGSVNSEIQVYRANSQYVTVPAPSFVTDIGLAEGGLSVVPIPTYTLSPAVLSVGEGETTTYTVNTENVSDGTILYWVIEGTTADFNAVSGTVTINSNTGLFNVTTKSDLVTEGTESFAIRLRTGSISGPTVESGSITITELPTYTITPSTLTVNEGSTGTFTVNTTSVPNGTQIFWITSAPSSDIPIGSGSFTINNNTGSFNITPSADSLTEGVENYTVTLTINGGTVVGTANIIINDTSVTGAPTYILAPAGLTINEGGSGTFTVNTENVDDDTVLYWTVNGTTADFNAVSGSFTINSDTGSFSVSPKEDSLTEGAETYTVSIRTDSVSGTIVDSTTFTVNDTSLSPTLTPTYSLSGPSVVNEGSSGTYTLTTTNVGDGTTLYYTITNLTSENEDFTATQGTFTVNSGTGTFNVSLVADATTEGAESFTVRVRTGGFSGTIVAEASTTIGDTSTTPPAPTPTYAVSYSPAGTPAGSFNEGTPITALVTTTNVPGGTTLYWTINATTADFSAISGSFTVNFNSGQFNILPLNDSLTEGNETFTISIRTGSINGTVVATKSITIIDTSITPPTTYALSYSPAGTPAGSFNEGSSTVALVTTTNVPNGTTLYYSITGATTADFNSVVGSFTINFNSGQFTISPRADSLTEGSETYTVTIRTGSVTGPIVESKSITIVDTSTTPAPPVFTFSYTSNRNNASLRTDLLNAGWNGSDEVVATVNSGVYLYSNTTSAFGLSITGSYPGGVRLINRGYIIGAGGNGANGLNGSPTVGATALAIGSSGVTIENRSYIAGGGGGGSRSAYSGGGGGAGGGDGGDGIGWGSGTNRAGGNGATTPGTSGSDGSGYTTTQAGKGGGAGGGGGAGADFGSSQGYGGGGGGGGMILPGVGGASGDPNNTAWGGTGANTGEGGSAGNPGSPGAGAYGGEDVGAGGGGWGARGGAGSTAGALGGAAIQTTTAYSLINTGTIYGTT